jgi:hypothetical protein
VVKKHGPETVDSTFSEAFNSAITKDLHDAFFLYTGQNDAEVFADFIVALILLGRTVYTKCTEDHEQLAKLKVSRDAYFYSENFLLALVNALNAAGVSPDLNVDLCVEIADAQLEEIRRIDLKGKGPVRPRIEGIESAKTYQANLKTDFYVAELTKRWPALARPESSAG